MDVTFPYSAIIQDIRFTPVGRSASGGFGLDGSRTTVASNSGHWIAQAQIIITGREAELGWSAFLAGMQGVLGNTLVPYRDRVRPYDKDGHVLSCADAVSIGGLPIADNVGLAQTDVTRATLKSAVSLRDTFLQVEYANTTGIRPGHRIGIGDRLHEVISSSGDDGAETTLQVFPPMREAYPAGERVILDRPKCKMQFESPDQGLIAPNVTRVHQLTVNFREVL